MEKVSWDRFEIPINPREFNVFAVDDYLRAISIPSRRHEILEQYGRDEEGIKKYEEENDLPRGAFEIAVLIECPMIKRMSSEVCEIQVAAAKDPKLQALFETKAQELSAEIQKRYPRATDLLNRYNAQLLNSSSRNLIFVNNRMGEGKDKPITVASWLVWINAIALANAVVNANAIANANLLLNANLNANANANWNANVNASGGGGGTE